jgi:hypothetical protein
VNNTQKLDDIRRRLRVIDVRMAVIQRATVVIYERVTGRPFSSSVLFSDGERALLARAEAADPEFWQTLMAEFGPR